METSRRLGGCRLFGELLGAFPGHWIPTGFTDTPAEYRQWFVDKETQIALLTFGLMLAFSLILLFASGLRNILGPADDANNGMWSRLSFAGAIMMVSMAGAGAAFWAVIGLEEVLATASDETVKTLSIFDTVFFTAIVPWGMAVFLLGASVVILQSGVMAKWTGWLGLLIAVLVALGSLWPSAAIPRGSLAPWGSSRSRPGSLSGRWQLPYP